MRKAGRWVLVVWWAYLLGALTGGAGSLYLLDRGYIPTHAYERAKASLQAQMREVCPYWWTDRRGNPQHDRAVVVCKVPEFMKRDGK